MIRKAAAVLAGITTAFVMLMMMIVATTYMFGGGGLPLVLGMMIATFLGIPMGGIPRHHLQISDLRCFMRK